MEIGARPGAHEGGRAKRITEPESNRRSTGGRGPSGSAGSVAPAGKANGVARDLRQTISRIEQERDRAAARLQQAEEDLDVAQQRLEDADSARRHLLDNVASGGDEARRRFASALHDDALQLLTAAELQLERLRVDARQTKYAADLEKLRTTMKLVEESLRNLLYNVSPASVDLHMRLSDSIRDRAVALKQHTGIEAELDIRLPDAVPAVVKTNVFKGGISIVISDDGTGFVVAESLHLPGHLGLIAMRERAHLAGGWCRLDSEPGAGTRVSFWIPFGP